MGTRAAIHRLPGAEVLCAVMTRVITDCSWQALCSALRLQPFAAMTHGRPCFDSGFRSVVAPQF